MKFVKCYGRAKITTVDSSFKRQFFGSFDSKSYVEGNSFQDFQQKENNLSNNVSSTSDFTDVHSFELFTSNTDFFDKTSSTLSTLSPVNVKNIRKKHKSFKNSISNKTCGRQLQNYKKRVLKRKSIISNRSLRKHSCVPIQSRNSEFCENPLSIINTGVKKRNKVGLKKKKLIKKAQDVASNISGIDKITSFNSTHNCDLSIKQPRWSSINEYSFEIEKVSENIKKTIPLTLRQQANKNASFLGFIAQENEPFSSKECIPGDISVQSGRSSNCKCHLVVEEILNDDEALVKNEKQFKQSRGLNFISSETIGVALETVKDISENAVSCKSPSISCTNLEDGHALSGIENCEDRHISNEVASFLSDICQTVSEDLNVNAVNEEENTSKAKGKRIETYGEEIRSECKEYFTNTTQTNFIASVANSDKKNNENVNQLQDNSSLVLSKKSKGFYSSTPLSSPFNPIFSKCIFVASTPILSPKTQQNKTCNVSRTYCFGRQHNSLQRCPEISSSIRKNKSINSSTHTPFIKGSSHNNQNLQSFLSRSSAPISRKEQLDMIEKQCSAKSCSLSNMTPNSSLTNNNVENGFESILSHLLKFCGQTGIIPFDQLYDWSCSTFRKIGEGTYGEVFTVVQNKISSVVKVIPFSEDDENHSMQSIGSVLSEVTVSQCLSDLRNNKSNKTRNFIKLKSVHLVKGCYPNKMLVAWDKFSDVKTTYNNRPEIYTDNQMFAIIELEYGGKDMTSFALRNATEAESVLKQIAISLAIAEEVHLFEHRDLHLGNILVQRNSSKTISYVLNGKSFSIPNHGLVVTLIDFTLSRVLHKGCIFYNDLAGDDSLFNQTGDLQFHIYKDTKILLNNEWHKCLLYSNVLWLTYLCQKLLEYKYRLSSSKKHEQSLNKLKTFQNNLGSCQNAFEFITTSSIHSSIPKHEQSSAQKMNIKAKFIDRKSKQSFLQHISNIS